LGNPSQPKTWGQRVNLSRVKIGEKRRKKSLFPNLKFFPREGRKHLKGKKV